MEKIDAHHHYWIYTPEEYDWISDDMAAIRGDYQPTDLRDDPCQVCGTAGQTDPVAPFAPLALQGILVEEPVARDRDA